MKCPSCGGEQLSDPLPLSSSTSNPTVHVPTGKGRFGIVKTTPFDAAQARVCPDCGYFALYLNDSTRADFAQIETEAENA